MDWESIDKVYVGQAEANAIYIGDEKVWSKRNPCITFLSPSSFTLKVNNSTKNWNGTIEYSTDLNAWSTWNGSNTLTAVSDGSNYALYLRGSNNTILGGNRSYYGWVLDGSDITCFGDIRYLLNYSNISNIGTLQSYCFGYLFYQNTGLLNSFDLSGITNLSTYCFAFMFYDCNSLTEAPELPAMTLADYCYEYMFGGCTSLLEAPELPATTLADGCYTRMFDRCTSLTEAPELPATTLFYSCYYGMFYNCTSLKKLPDLPALSVASQSYEFMFYNCTSIKLSQTQVSYYRIPFRIPVSGSGTYGNDSVRNMFSGTGGIFTSNPVVNTTYYLWDYDYVEPSVSFKSPSSFTLKVNNSTKNWNGTIEYSTDLETWSIWNSSDTLTAVSDGSNYALYLRGSNNTKLGGDSNTYRWILTGSDITCFGDIRYLLNYSDITNIGTLLSYCFGYLFYQNTGLLNSFDLSGITNLSTYCFAFMYRECSNLTTPSALPSTSLTEGCYYGMYEKCTNLTSAPALPAQTLATYCYRAMFSECSSLTLPPVISATTLAVGCYRYMLNRCTALTAIPALPVTDIPAEAYYNFLSNNTNIKFSTTQTGEYQNAYRIPTTGTGTMASGATSNMLSGTGGTFKSNPAVNTTYYTSNTIV